MTDFEVQARAALAAKNDTQRQLAAASVCPPWRHAVFGLLFGVLVAAPAFDPPIRYAFIAAIFCAIPLIARSDRKRMGMFVNGYRRGKTRIVAVAVAVVELGIYTFGTYRSIELGDHRTALLLALLAFAIGWIGSVMWQRVFVSELAA